MSDTSLFAEIVMERCVQASGGVPTPRQLAAAYYWSIMGLDRQAIGKRMGITAESAQYYTKQFIKKVSTAGYCDNLRFDLAAEYWLKRGRIAS